MKPIQRFYLGLVAVLTALWAFADPAWRASDPNYFVWRASLTNLTGVLGIAVMSVCACIGGASGATIAADHEDG